jgi:hypothetical protein
LAFIAIGSAGISVSGSDEYTAAMRLSTRESTLVSILVAVHPSSYSVGQSSDERSFINVAVSKC